MAGSLFSFFVVTGLLAAPAAGDFSSQGREASARTLSSEGFFAQGPTPYPSMYERGIGSASLEVEDRVTAPAAPYGDEAQLEARIRIGGTEYQVELTQTGFPPQAAEAASARPLPLPGNLVEGGVMLNRDLHGNSGLGWPAMTRVHAAVAVWGVGRVLRNGQLLTDNAVILATALSHGAQADDDTHLTLPLARAGDTELHVLAWNLPPSAEPRGFIQFSFDDVEIEVDDELVRGVARLPNVQGVESDGVGPVVFGGVGQGGAFLPPSPRLQPGEAVGGSGFDPTVAPERGLPGGPVTPVSPATLGGPASPDPSAVPGIAVGTRGTATLGVPGEPVIGPVTPTVPVRPRAVTPDTISGTFPTTGAPTPPANISGVMPGTPAPGSALAEQAPVLPGAPPPGGPAEVGVAMSPFGPSPAPQGSFFVPSITPPDFRGLASPTQVSPGIIATPPPIGTDPTTPTPPLLGSPAPLTAAPATPLLGTPAPLNAAGGTPLIGAPAPGNVAPGATSATPGVPGATPVTPAPGGAVPPPGGAGVPPSI